VCECPNCSIALTFHRAANRVVCHICGHNRRRADEMPRVQADPEIKYTGTGTEKVEDTVTKFFPKAVVKRMDADTMHAQARHTAKR
jgi:primosomal protein N' (replication factor Y)